MKVSIFFIAQTKKIATFMFILQTDIKRKNGLIQFSDAGTCH
jgi:hypothetical protein